MKNKINKFRILLLIFTLTLVPSTAYALESQAADSFSDLTELHQNYSAINYLYQTDIIKGYDDGTFKADKDINRAESLKIILKGSGISENQAFKNYFPDVKESDWFAPYVVKAKELGFVQGNSNDGTFTPNRQVNLVELLKMLTKANNIDLSAYQNASNEDEWYAPYLNFALEKNIITSSQSKNPSKLLTRGEVSEIIYLLVIYTHTSDTQFLLTRAENEMVQVELYLLSQKPNLAKKASSLAVRLTQQTYQNLSENNIVLSAAKLAKAYDYLTDAYIYGSQGSDKLAEEWANKAIDKATEAWEVNNNNQTFAAHIKERAREILNQVGGSEYE